MLAESAYLALAVTAAAAAAARALRAVDTSGALAGLVVGAIVSAALGLPGILVLGGFFVLGTAVTRLGWAQKRAAGTAERGAGARDAARVLGKGGVAALVALLPGAVGVVACCGALAAAAADTVGTEIGVLARGGARTLPTFRAVEAGTPGGVSLTGTAAAAGGAGGIAILAGVGFGLTTGETVAIGCAGLGAALLESLLVGLVPVFARSPGWVRNVWTTAAGASLVLALWSVA